MLGMVRSTVLRLLSPPGKPEPASSKLEAVGFKPGWARLKLE